MRNFLGIVVVSASLLSAPWVRGQSAASGTDWRDWRKDIKVMYLLGWVDGRACGVWDALEALDEKRRDSALKNGIDKDPKIGHLGTNVTVGQLLEGIDKFYEDHRNLHIEVRTAVSAISNEASGRLLLDDAYMQRLREISARTKRE